MNFEEMINQVRKYNHEHPTTARQGLYLETIEPGQLHRCKNSVEHTEFFYLILEDEGDTCRIIPGSLDGFMAGPEDMVLPKDVMGDFVFLASSMEKSVAKDKIGHGFAILDEHTFNLVKARSYSKGLPFTPWDSRKIYREELRNA